MARTPQRTPLTMAEVRGYLSEYVQQPVLGYLMAMVAFENRNGAAIWDHNWGNITTNDPSEAFQFSGNSRHFLSLPDHAEGARRFVLRLGSRTHKRILEAAARNDFTGFIAGLREPHPVTKMAYVPDLTDAHAVTYRALVKTYVPRSALRSSPKVGGGVGLAVALLFGAGAGGAYLLLRAV